MLDELIRYAIDGIILDPNLSERSKASRIQELIDILIDFSDYTDKDLREILVNYKQDMIV